VPLRLNEEMPQIRLRALTPQDIGRHDMGDHDQVVLGNGATR
jgi:hypothetical protein